MNKNIADKWVAALRSGKYAQGMSRLVVDDTYCCLGVLCELAVEDGITFRVRDDYTDAPANARDGEESYSSAIVTDKTQEWAGMYSPWGITRDNSHQLTDMNDSEKLSFDQIADFIEENFNDL